MLQYEILEIWSAPCLVKEKPDQNFFLAMIQLADLPVSSLAYYLLNLVCLSFKIREESLWKYPCIHAFYILITAGIGARSNSVRFSGEPARISYKLRFQSATLP